MGPRTVVVTRLGKALPQGLIAQADLAEYYRIAAAAMVPAARRQRLPAGTGGPQGTVRGVPLKSVTYLPGAARSPATAAELIR
ncbi:hypothetical protein [Streptomyces sp. NPDC058011]|uniref:hypothetical protein n=1 Tax=Streptomyces sp. NPDC058011 TaxID=3346305 RepID=UPI0036EEE484